MVIYTCNLRLLGSPDSVENKTYIVHQRTDCTKPQHWDKIIPRPSIYSSKHINIRLSKDSYRSIIYSIVCVLDFEKIEGPKSLAYNYVAP